MFTEAIGNPDNKVVKLKEVDLFDDEQAKQFGRILAENTVVHIDKETTGECDRARMHAIHAMWGQPYSSHVLRAIAKGDLKPHRHWRDIYLNMGYIVSEVPEPFRDSQTSVTFKKNEKNKPVGIFAEGELGWHTDFPAVEDGHKVASLISIHDTEGSQTEFLPTPRTYQSLNHEDKTMVDELINVYKTIPEELEKFFPGLGKGLPMQKAWTRWAGIPFTGCECPLKRTTAAGLEGLNFPIAGFSHFKGMDEDESEKFRKHLWNKLNQPDNIYTHNWVDGEIVAFDLDITIHRRPTNVTHGYKRYLVRTGSHLDNLYPGQGSDPKFVVNGKRLTYEEFVEKADTLCKQEYEAGVYR